MNCQPLMLEGDDRSPLEAEIAFWLLSADPLLGRETLVERLRTGAWRQELTDERAAYTVMTVGSLDCNAARRIVAGLRAAGFLR